MIRTYHGSCHCSICRRNRFWPAIARREQFRLLTGASLLTHYTFNTRKNHHYFCRHCGVRPYGVGTETPMGEMVGVNIGCVDGMPDRWDRAPEFAGHL